METFNAVSSWVGSTLFRVFRGTAWTFIGAGAVVLGFVLGNLGDKKKSPSVGSFWGTISMLIVLGIGGACTNCYMSAKYSELDSLERIPLMLTSTCAITAFSWLASFI